MSHVQLCYMTMSLKSREDEDQSHTAAFEAWDGHSRAQRLDNGLTAVSILRASHPDHHVVRIDPKNCDLQGFAAAGFATWTDGSSGKYDALRLFAAPGLRIEKSPGSLADRVCFGRAGYEWEGKTFAVYETMYRESFLGEPQKVLFVLGPRGDKIIDGHHKDIDDLLLACGRWTRQLHEEIFAFDNGFWYKDKALYQSVQSASWDDVILDPETKAKLIDDMQGFFENQALYKSFQVPWKRGVSTYITTSFATLVSLTSAV